MSSQDRGRLRRVYDVFGATVLIRAIGQYHNSKSLSHMQWAVFEMSKHPLPLEPNLASR
jgi:hypothetical protein